MGLFHPPGQNPHILNLDTTTHIQGPLSFIQSMDTFVQNIIAVSLEALPFLAFGFFIAGILKSFVPEKWVIRTLGRTSTWFMSPIKGALIGTPIPLCSCSVIPVATALKDQGANKGALTAFLVSAPETGADSLSLSYALLGPIMLFARLISATATAIMTAWAVMITTGKNISLSTPAMDSCNTECCKNQNESTDSLNGHNIPLWNRFLNGQRHAYTTFMDDIFKYMLLALIFTALMRTFFPINMFAEYSYGIYAMILTVVIAFPMYICAAASTPIAAWMLLSGISPGVVLVFMLAGPASNIATVMVVRHLMGGIAAIVYVISISLISIGAGLMLNILTKMYHWDIVAQAQQQNILNQEIAIILSLFVLICAIKPLRKYIGGIKNR